MARIIDEIDKNIFEFVDKEKPTKFPFKIYCNLCDINLIIQSKRVYLIHMNSEKHIHNNLLYSVPSKSKESPNDQLKRKHNQSETVIDEVLSGIEIYRKMKSELEEKNALNEKHIVDLQNQVEKLNSKCTTLEKKNSKLKKKINNKTNGLSNIINTKKQKIDQLESEKLNLELQNDNLIKLSTDYNETIVKLNKEKDDLSENIQEKEEIIKCFQNLNFDLEANNKELANIQAKFTLEFEKCKQNFLNIFEISIIEQHNDNFEINLSQFELISQIICDKYQQIKNRLEKLRVHLPAIKNAIHQLKESNESSKK
jgi:chromosome segregation ATPase